MPKHRTPLPPELKELIQLIRHGRLYDVQGWIRDGKPIRLPAEGHFILTPMQAAIRTGFHSMVDVMLEALSKEENMDDLLHEAVRMNRLDLIQLVHRYGANPKAICYDCVAATHDPLILRWFEVWCTFFNAFQLPMRTGGHWFFASLECDKVQATSNGPGPVIRLLFDRNEGPCCLISHDVPDARCGKVRSEN